MMESIPYSPNYTYYFASERSFNTSLRQKELHDGILLPYALSALYVVLIFAGKEMMKNRAPYRLKPLLVLWNACLCVFSVIGSLRLLPELIHVLTTYGFGFSVCQSTGFAYNPIYSYWCYLFTVSKVFELGDTGFVVLRKRDLRFIHWFHHAATLIITWHGFVELVAYSRWFITMNFTIHSFMYAYYTISAAGYKLPRWVAMPITMSQVVQMFAGTIVSFYGLYRLLSGGSCHVSYGLSFAFSLLYSFYVYLFLTFFISSYFGKSAKFNSKTSATEMSNKSKVN